MNSLRKGILYRPDFTPNLEKTVRSRKPFVRTNPANEGMSVFIKYTDRDGNKIIGLIGTKHMLERRARAIKIEKKMPEPIKPIGTHWDGIMFFVPIFVAVGATLWAMLNAIAKKVSPEFDHTLLIGAISTAVGYLFANIVNPNQKDIVQPTTRIPQVPSLYVGPTPTTRPLE